VSSCVISYHVRSCNVMSWGFPSFSSLIVFNSSINC
jgi:hypothetical protein